MDRITWHRRSIGQSGWDGIAGSLSLFTIEPSPAPHAAWMLRTRLPIRIGFTMAVRHHSDDDRQLQQQAELVLTDFITSLGAVWPETTSSEPKGN